uniref:Autophagy-related protein 9 n=1 Tax=Coturnix japonica TaxID=93934 RepID=A0A8C2T4A9_COTJA
GAMAEAEYHRLEDPEEESPPGEEELLLHVTEGRQGSWHHIKNLDDFFTKISCCKNGFACMLLSDLFELGQFVFVVAFSAFLLCCVRYDVLFADRPLNRSHVPPERSKVTLPDAVLPAPQCARRIAASGWLVFLLAMAALFWLCRLLKVLRGLFDYWDIRRFYGEALRIPALCNYSWQEVQARLIGLQREHQICIHKKELTELDIYHRILRFKNYMVAMVNKSLLPVRFRLPLLGPVVFLTRGLLYNLELLLFRGPGALFLNSWSLRPQYKRAGERLALARRLARSTVLLGAANLLLCPLVLVWQLLYAFFSYAEVLRRRPGVLGTRRWSLYGRLYLRHFNELQHELTARLGRGHRPATRYMNSFPSPMMAVLARHVAFFAGSVLAVLIALTVYDEDVLTVQHILTAITMLGLLLTVARSFIPDEHSVQCPEQLLQRVLAHTHYMPQQWRGSAGAAETRNEMGQLFQYKAMFIVEELLSPILTPLILIFALPPRALDIVDFFRNFTVEVVGVGDVCSFAQLDVRRHGNPQWLSEGQTEASVYQRAENGKTELSLMHFAISNPRWQPPPHSGMFLSHVKERLQRDAAPHGPAEGALRASLLGDGCAAVRASGAVGGRGDWGGWGWDVVGAGGSLGAVRLWQWGSHWAGFLPHSGAVPPRSPVLSESHLLSLSRSAVLAEVASAEMSLHAIYIHEVSSAGRTAPSPPSHTPCECRWGAGGAPRPTRGCGALTCPVPCALCPVPGSAARASQHELREMPLGGWAEEDEDEEDEEEEEQTTR